MVGALNEVVVRVCSYGLTHVYDGSKNIAANSIVSKVPHILEGSSLIKFSISILVIVIAIIT